MRTVSAKPGQVQQDWFLVDAAGRTLGRLASELAVRLRGKHKREFTPHVDIGDFIVVVNASKVRVSGDKLNQKIYHRHSGYIGNLKSVPLKKVMQDTPERAVFSAVRGMLPKNRLGRAMLKKLKIYPGPEHKHAAQQPKPLEIQA